MPSRRARIVVSALAALLCTLVLAMPSGAGRLPFTSDPNAARLGRVAVGSSASETLTITNSSGTAYQLGFRAQNPDAPFSVVSDNCFGPFSLQPGDTCTVEISFDPATTGRFTDVVGWNNAANPTQIVASVKLSGTGVAP